MAVENEYLYISAIILHGDNKNIPEKLELTNVKVDQVNHRNVINLSLKILLRVILISYQSKHTF